VGVLFDETSPERIAATVNQALSDRPRYELMKANCLKAARELNWEIEECRLRRVFADLLGGKAAAVPEPAAAHAATPVGGAAVA
jgi:hypothetical protein